MLHLIDTSPAYAASLQEHNGSRYNHRGGAVNYLCMPGDPDYLRYQSGVQGYSDVYGVEYQPHSGPLSAIHKHNAPCTMCYASTRVAVTMIPAKAHCPSTWTLQYSGYLISAASLYGHQNCTRVNFSSCANLL